MQLDIGIVRTYRLPDSISMRPNGPNTLAFQSASTNDARDTLYMVQLHVILTVSRTRYVYIYVYSLRISTAIVIATITPPRYKPTHFRIWYAILISAIGNGSFYGHYFRPTLTHNSLLDETQFVFG